MLKPLIQLILPSLIILGIIYIIYWVVSTVKKQQFEDTEEPKFKVLVLNRLKRFKWKYILGYSLLALVLIYQGNRATIHNIVSDVLIHITYNPQPGVKSPWPWRDEKKHPIVSDIPPSVETSIESVARYIGQHESNPYYRIKALHDYVVNRISYDLDVLKTGVRPPQDAETVFATGKAVCEGYANLFQALGKAIGEKIVVVTGKIRRDMAPKDLIPIELRIMHSQYDWTLHAWNAVKISGKWHLVDVTWDDNKLSYNAEYLMPPPEVMSIGHFPDQLSWQLVYPSENYETFEKKPILYPQFYAEKLKIISPIQYQSQVKKTANIVIEAPASHQRVILAIYIKQENEVLLWEVLQKLGLQTSQTRKIKRCQSQQDAGGRTQISCEFTEPGIYQVLLYSYSPGQSQKRIEELGKLKFDAL